MRRCANWFKSERNTKLTELRNRAELTQDQLDIQRYRDYGDACKRFEKRIFDLETTRLVSIQMAPQIRTLQNANQQGAIDAALASERGIVE